MNMEEGATTRERNGQIGGHTFPFCFRRNTFKQAKECAENTAMMAQIKLRVK